MKQKLFVLVIGLVLSVFTVSLGHAAEDAEYAISSTVTISDNLAASVRTIIEVDSGAALPANLSIPALGQDIKGLEATYDDNKSLNAENRDGIIQLLTTPAQSSGSKKVSIKLSYTSSLGVGFGRSLIVLVPPQNYDGLNIVSESVTVNTSDDLGTPLYRGTEPTSTTFGAGNLVFNWEDQDSALEQSYGLIFGDNALANVTLNKTLQNDSLWWSTKSVVLPPDTNQQRVFINSISPEPTNISLDEDGNIILDYRLGPRQKVDIEAQTSISLNSYVYSLDSTLGVNDIDQVIRDRYTNLNDEWRDTQVEVDNAQSLFAVDLIRQIYDGVVSEFEEVSGDNQFDLSSVRANALVGELRTHGVPARLVIGAVFGDGRQLSQSPISHAWVEAYIPSVGWITLDPTFEQGGDYFGVTDIQRIALAVRGFDPKYPPENLTDFHISFQDKDLPAIPQMKPEISAKKYVLFPGFSYQSINISMPPGVIVDDAGVVVGDDDLGILGSLAPLQNIQLRSFDLLANAFTSESVQYGIFATSDLDAANIIGQATVEVSYIPMIALIILSGLVLLFVKFAWPKLRISRDGATSKKAVKKDRSSKDALVIATDNEGEQIEHIDMLPNSIEESNEIVEVAEQEPAPINLEPRPMPAERQPPVATHVPVNSVNDAHPRVVRREVKRRRPPLIQ